jgi:hypothetical protein
VLNWIISNKEWVFSGVGLVIFGGIFKFLMWVFKKQNREKADIINQSQKSGKNSTNIQIAGDLTINRGVKNGGDEPILPIPSIGNNPFKNIKEFTKEKFIPSNEEYFSPATKGQVTFDYANNNGRYTIGQNEFLFELEFSKANDTSIYIYNDHQSINTVALVKDATEIYSVRDARKYDTSSRTRCPQINQIAVLQNTNGFYAAIQILDIQDDTRGAKNDAITFAYAIQTNGTSDFTNLEIKYE